MSNATAAKAKGMREGKHMSATTGKHGKKLSRPPQSRAAAWYAAPSFAIPFSPYPLTDEQRTKLLGIVGKNNLPDKKVEEFAKHISVALGAYCADNKYFKSMKPNQIGRRLKWLRDRSLELLTDEPRGLANLDEVTMALLTDALPKERSDLPSVRRAVIALHNAANAALAGQKRLPNRWKDHPIHALAHRTAVIMRDVVGVNPTKVTHGRFARLVLETARLAGRGAVSKEVIFDAIDLLKRENVMRTGRKIGIRDGAPMFEELPVSDIRPVVIGKEPAGKLIYSYTVSADGTLTDHPVRYTKGGESIYATSSNSVKSKNPHRT